MGAANCEVYSQIVKGVNGKQISYELDSPMQLMHPHQGHVHGTTLSHMNTQTLRKREREKERQSNTTQHKT